MSATVGGGAPPTIDRPLACVVRVRGALAPACSARLGGLRIAPAGDGAASELRGALPDQTALLDVLIARYGLGSPLLAVACEPRRWPDASPGRASHSDLSSASALLARRRRRRPGG